MLVLSRQRDQSIMIGDDVEITIVDVRGDKVRIGINAPKEVAVHRKEVYEAIRRENAGNGDPQAEPQGEDASVEQKPQPSQRPRDNRKKSAG